MKDIYDIAYEISNLINEWGYKNKPIPNSEVDLFHLLQEAPLNDKEVEYNLLAIDCLKKLKILYNRDVSVPYIDDDLINMLKDQIKLYKKLKIYGKEYSFDIKQMIANNFDLAIKCKTVEDYAKKSELRDAKYRNY